MPALSFAGQVAVVTGGGRGLGRAYALDLARRGASVLVADIGRDADMLESRAERVAAEIVALGGTAVPAHDDVATPEGGEALLAQAMDRFGKVDVLINNAGFLWPGEFHELTPGDIAAVVGVHLMGAFHVTLPAWRAMRERRYGRIVMTGSSSSFGHQGNSGYAAAKAAMFGLTQSLALEGEAFGIKVNAILPVATTEMSRDTPLGGPGQARLMRAFAPMNNRRPPSSVAPMVTYLASAACAVNGHSYSAAAGRYARAFLGLAEGWIADDVDAVTAESIASHLEQIEGPGRFLIPGSMIEEFEDVGARLSARPE